MMQTRASVALVVGVAVLVAAAGSVSASHLPEVTARCTYESGMNMNQIGMAAEDPTGLTSDGAINKDVCLFEFPETDPGPPPITSDPREVVRELIRETFTAGSITVSGQYSQAQASIVDDLFGAGTVGGVVAADFDHNTVFGEDDKGEPSTTFCGTSSMLETGNDTDGDGHPDFGWAVAVFTNGPVRQVLNCDAVQAPTATTGGVLDPAGGIYLTVSG